MYLNADIYGNADVIAVLTESAGPAAYWRKLKQWLKAEGSETVTNCHGLKMRAADGKKRLTDVVNTERLKHISKGLHRGVGTSAAACNPHPQRVDG